MKETASVVAYLPLTRRAEFLAVAASQMKFVKSHVVIQLYKRPEGNYTAADAIRAGFTATKKIGGAVVRNRAKRRLRAAARELLPRYGIAGYDYVFIGRDKTPRGTFDDLIDDMKHALKRLSQTAQTQSNSTPLPTSEPH